MVEKARFLRRSLNAFQAGGYRGLDVLRWPTLFGSGLRIYFARGSEAKFRAAEGAEVSITSSVVVSGNVIATGKAPAGNGAVDLRLADQDLTLQVAEPETELFDDLNVMVAQRHGESVQQVADWLRYHVEHHALSGAVIVDRDAPGQEREEFAEQLRQVCAGMPELRRVVLVDCPVPLGAEGQAALYDPARAPRAKGRKPKADEWHAPLNQPVLYDILKWRFLTRAGSVIALDPCDLLRVPSDGIAVFEAARQSHTGMMPVQGELCFPWRVRKGQAPVSGDHICRAKPAIKAPNRWAIAPKRAPSDAVWLAGGITNMTALVDEVIHYDRAQAIVMPKAEVAELVNKDVLELAPALVKRARKVFDHAPVMPPERKMAKVAPAASQPSGRTLIVTCMKNEGPFILEWLAYHRMIGVDDFLIYTNDCDDGRIGCWICCRIAGWCSGATTLFAKPGASRSNPRWKRRRQSRWWRRQAGSSRWMWMSSSMCMSGATGWKIFMRRWGMRI